MTKHGKPRARREHRSAQAGFTLLEMLLVVGIMATLGALLAARFNLDATSLAGQGARLASALRDARTRAIEQRRVVVVRLDVGRRIVEPGDGARPLHLPGDVDLELHVGEAAAGRQGVGVVRFFPNGSSSGGRLELRRHGERFSIGINWFTGRIDAEASRS